MEEVLIPIVLFILVFAIPLTAIIVDGRNRRSRDRVLEKAVESGMDLTELEKVFPVEKAKRRGGGQPYRKGLILIAVGAALLVVHGFVGANGDGELRIFPNHDEPEARGGMLVGGMICLFLGLAMVISDFLNRGARRRDAERHQD